MYEKPTNILRGFPPKNSAISTMSLPWKGLNILHTKRDIKITITAKYIILIQADEPVLIIRFLGKLIII